MSDIESMTPATLATITAALAVAKVKYTREQESAKVRIEPYPRPEEMARLEEMRAYFARMIEGVDQALEEIQERN